jgi:hypothetical protein
LAIRDCEKYIDGGFIMAMMKNAERQLVAYTVGDEDYQNPALKFILGRLAGIDGNMDKIEPNPADACIPLKAEQMMEREIDGVLKLVPVSQDQVVYTFRHGADVRALFANIVTLLDDTEPVKSSGTTYRLLALPRFGGGAWAELAKGITLKTPGSAGGTAPTNPPGMAYIEPYMYIIDYDSTFIYILGGNELNGQEPGEYTMKTAPFDVKTTYEEETGNDWPPGGAHGQAIIALTDETGKNYTIFALYIFATGVGEQAVYSESMLVRIPVKADGSLDGTKIAGCPLFGKNAVEITAGRVMINGIEEQVIWVPSIGGKQQGSGTNKTESNLMTITAFGDWNGSPSEAPRILLTGDNSAGLPENFDFRQIVMSSTGGGRAVVYILTASFSSSYAKLNWKLYKTRAHSLYDIQDPPVTIPPTPPMTISEAVSAGILRLADEGTVDGYEGIFFLALLFENGESHTGDRLYAFYGTKLLVTNANAYGSPNKPENFYLLYDRGFGPGKIGGENVNGADLPAEANRQADAGVSLKHSVAAIRVPAAGENGNDGN